MAFIALEVAVDLIRHLREPVATVAQRHPSLADQLRRAADSIPLNLAEGRRRAGKDRLHCWRIAAGSANELLVGLRVAEAMGSPRRGGHRAGSRHVRPHPRDALAPHALTVVPPLPRSPPAAAALAVSG